MCVWGRCACVCECAVCGGCVSVYGVCVGVGFV